MLSGTGAGRWGRSGRLKRGELRRRAFLGSAKRREAGPWRRARACRAGPGQPERALGGRAAAAGACGEAGLRRGCREAGPPLAHAPEAEPWAWSGAGDVLK